LPCFREPDVAIRSDGDVDRRSIRTRDWKLRHLSIERDPADAVAIRLTAVHPARELHEPHRAVDTGRDVAGSAVRSRQRELCDDAGRRDAADLARVELGEPDVAIRSGRHGARSAVRCRNRKLRDDPGRRDAADLATGKLSKPHVPVNPTGGGARLAVRRRDIEFGDRPVVRDRSESVSEMLGKPDVAVGTNRDDARRTSRMREIKLDEPRAVLRHAADPIAVRFGEPEQSVGRNGHGRGPAVGIRQRKFRELSGRLKSCRMRCTRRHDGQRYRKATQAVTSGNSVRWNETYSHSDVLKFSHGTMKVKRRFACVLAVAVALCATAGSGPVRGQTPRPVASHPTTSTAAPVLDATAERALVDKYCVSCHNSRLKTAGLVLDKDTVDLARVPDRADIWEKVIRKLHGRMMPPQGMPRPDEDTIDAFAASLETSIDRAALGKPNPRRSRTHSPPLPPSSELSGPNARPPVGCCWGSTPPRRLFCPPTTKRTGSTTSRTC